MPIVCAAVVGRQNNPLFLETYGPAAANASTSSSSSSGDEALRFHYAVHCALDAVEERLSAPRPRATAPDPDAGYLGVLYPTDDCVVYGSAGPTGVKVILVAADPQPGEDAVRAAAAGVAAAYGAAAANPFYTPGTPLTSKVFAGRVRAIVEAVS